MRVIAYLLLFSVLALALTTGGVQTSCTPDAHGLRQQHTSVCVLVFCANWD